MNAIIVEDNPMHQLEIELLLDQNNMNLLGKFNNCDEASKFLSTNKIDFIVLDLFMNNKNEGIQFAKKIKDKEIPYIICTSYPYKDLPDELQDLNALGFLVKPINEYQFAYELNKLKLKNDASELLDECIIIRERKNLIKLKHQEISHFVVEGNYSIINTKEKRYVLKKSLKILSKDLPTHCFIQVNRSTILNKEFIKQVDLTKKKITLNGGIELTIGQKFLTSVKELIDTLS